MSVFMFVELLETVGMAELFGPHCDIWFCS